MDIRNVLFHVFIASILITTFLAQAVLLNFNIIDFFQATPTTFLWFLADFACLLAFSFDAFIGYRRSEDRSRRDVSVSPEKRPLSRPILRPSSRSSTTTSRYDWPSNAEWFKRVKKLPTSCYAYLIYCSILIAKIVTVFKLGIMDSPDAFLNPQGLKIVIGLTAIVYSLLVEAHKDTHYDPIRNSYVNSLTFGVATEILDTLSFLSLLIASQSDLLFSFHFENVILALACLNILLPSIALVNLSVSSYGKEYSVPVETIYKLLHLLLVNGTYLGVRIYLWVLFTPDTSVFIIKNLYCILIFLRDAPQDIYKLRQFFFNRKGVRKVGAVEMQQLHSNGGSGGGLRDDTDAGHSFAADEFGGERREEGGEAILKDKFVTVDVEKAPQAEATEEKSTKSEGRSGGDAIST